jgi:hypothetical protein
MGHVPGYQQVAALMEAMKCSPVQIRASRTQQAQHQSNRGEAFLATRIHHGEDLLLLIEAKAACTTPRTAMRRRQTASGLLRTCASVTRKLIMQHASAIFGFLRHTWVPHVPSAQGQLAPASKENNISMLMRDRGP